MLLIIVLAAHFVGLKGEYIPLSWQEIYNDYLLSEIIFALGFAIFMSIYLNNLFNNEKKDVANNAVTPEKTG